MTLYILTFVLAVVGGFFAPAVGEINYCKLFAFIHKGVRRCLWLN